MTPPNVSRYCCCGGALRLTACGAATTPIIYTNNAALAVGDLATYDGFCYKVTSEATGSPNVTTVASSDVPPPSTAADVEVTLSGVSIETSCCWDVCAASCADIKGVSHTLNTTIAMATVGSDGTCGKVYQRDTLDAGSMPTVSYETHSNSSCTSKVADKTVDALQIDVDLYNDENDCEIKFRDFRIWVRCDNGNVNQYFDCYGDVTGGDLATPTSITWTMAGNADSTVCSNKFLYGGTVEVNIV